MTENLPFVTLSTPSSGALPAPRRRGSSSSRYSGRDCLPAPAGARRGAATGRATLREGLLERVEATAVGHALDVLDVSPLDLHGQRQTRQHGLTVHEHGAGATLAQLAPVLGARQAEVLAQHLEQGLVDGDDHVARLTVDRQRELSLHAPPKRRIPAAYGFREVELINTKVVRGLSSSKVPVNGRAMRAIGSRPRPHGALA